MNYVVLAAEISNDPLGRGYSAMTDGQIAGALNAPDRIGSNSLGAMLTYLLTIKHRTGQGADTTYTPVIGRLSHAASAAVGDDPFGRGSMLTLEQVHACRTILMLFQSPHLSQLDYSDVSLPFGYVNAAGVWSAAHKDALTALSTNRQSRAQELGLSVIDEGHVNYVRAA